MLFVDPLLLLPSELPLDADAARSNGATGLDVILLDSQLVLPLDLA